MNTLQTNSRKILWGDSVFQCLFLVCGLASFSTHGADSSPQQIIQNIQQVFHDWKRQGSLPDEQKRFPTFQARLDAEKDLQVKLSKHGMSAFTEIKTAIENNTVSGDARLAILRSLTDIPGIEVESYLLAVAAEDSPPSTGVLRILQSRSEQRDIEVVPTESQLAKFNDVILREHVAGAVHMAEAIQIFDGLPLEKRLAAIVQRLIQEVEAVPTDAPDPIYSPGSYRDFSISRILGFFTTLNNTQALPILHQAFDERAVDADRQNFLQLALAAAGDQGANKVAKAVADDVSQGPQLRTSAVWIYAKTAGMAALPDLRRWAQDKTTVVENMHKQERQPIATAAKYHLSVLEPEKNTGTPP